MKRRVVLAESLFAEVVTWRLPRVFAGSAHPYKYCLALVSDGICVPRYDIEVGKGDHIHRNSREFGFHFTDVDTLRKDFQSDTESWIYDHGKS